MSHLSHNPQEAVFELKRSQGERCDYEGLDARIWLEIQAPQTKCPHCRAMSSNFVCPVCKGEK